MLKRPFIPAFYLLLVLSSIQAAPQVRRTVTLPDDGTYTYWVQALSGVVTALPRTVRHKQTISPPLAADETLYVLDAHTGQVAARPITADDETIAIKVADFKPLAVPASSTPAATSPAATPPADATPENGGSGLGRLFTWLLGLLVAAGVGWVIWNLIKMRGEPLLALARRAGVHVPDPTPLGEDVEATAIYTPPTPRPIEKIPDEAGALPLPEARVQRGPAISLSTVPQIVGTQGLAAGTVFALTQSVVTIGREGENDIVLAENTVSRHHARLARDGQGRISLTDDGSANGVYVNGTRVERAILSSGDEIKIGDNFFRFEA